jgi:hypothetical protein
VQIVFAVAAIIFMILAGLNVRHPRFAPEWFAFACAFVALFWPLFDAID